MVLSLGSSQVAFCTGEQRKVSEWHKAHFLLAQTWAVCRANPLANVNSAQGTESEAGG